MRRALVAAGSTLALVAPAAATARPAPVPYQPLVAQQPTVPALVGLPLDSAVKILNRMHIRYDASVRVPSPPPYNSVVRQAPDPGTPVQAGMIVQLAISSGSEDGAANAVVVPDFVGLDKLSALLQLALKKLAAGAVDSILDEQHAGKVIRQSPEAGTSVPKGSPVSLWFGYGRPVTVPDLHGSTVADAARILEATGLQVGRRDSTAVDGAPGLVFRQQPLAGKQAARGSSVRIWYGYASPVVVPGLRDSTIAGARQRLQQVGLTLGKIDSTRSLAPTGRIVVQAPPAGQSAARGSSVAVTVQVDSLVVVPDVTGRDTGQADLALKHAGLVEGRIDLFTSETGSGQVLRQVPPAGSRVPPGTAIALQVAGTPSRIGVPPVVGLPESKAVRIIETAGLLAAPITHSPDPSGNHQVVKERPEAGTLVARGSAVALDVAVPVAPPARVMVPHVEGRTPAEAVAILENVELHAGNMTVVETTATANRVLHQAPQADQVVDTGTEVSLTVSKPLRRDTVPDVRRQPLASAESTLAARHFIVTVADTTSNRADSGRVLDQDPPGGTEVSPGSEVDLVVGLYLPTPLWLKLLAALGGIGGGVYGVVRLRQWWKDRPWRGRLAMTPRSDPGPPGRIDTDNLLTGSELGLLPRAAPISVEMAEDEPLIEGES